MSERDELLDIFEYYSKQSKKNCTLDERVLYSKHLAKTAAEFQARFGENILKALLERKKGSTQNDSERA